MKTSLLIFTATWLLLTSSFSEEGPDFWLTVNTLSSELWKDTKTKTHIQTRFPEFSEFTYFRISQKFSTKLNDKWSIGTHPVFESSKKGDDWKNTYRLDLELNPSNFKLGRGGPRISMRNRWELRWKEGKGSEVFHRVRQSSKATWRINGGPFSSYSVGNEVFFEEDKGKITINSFYPIMLGSRIGDRKISYYLLYQSKRSGTSSDWNSRYILGSSLSF